MVINEHSDGVPMATGKGRFFNRSSEEMELMRRHLRMLNVTKEYQPVGIIRLSEILDIPKHKVRYSLRLLEQDGLIKATPEGAVVTERYESFIAELSEHLDALEKSIASMRDELP